MKLLVVEDEVHVASLLAEVLTSEGHQVTVEEALALLGHQDSAPHFLDHPRSCFE